MKKSSHAKLSAQFAATHTEVVQPLYAAVDVGSNNVRMDLYGLDKEGRLKKIDITEQTVFPCKLAEGMSNKKPVIKQPNLDQAKLALRAFDTILKKYNITAENTCTVMTAAIRAVQYTERGKQDIAQLTDAYANRDYTILSGEEESILVGEAVKLACPQGWKKHRGKKGTMAFAAIGGGSVELGVITAEDKIEHAVALPYGIHTLIKKSHNKIPKAGKIFNCILHDNYPHHHHNILCVIGGNWRALGEAICGQIPASLKGKAIHKELLSATHRKEKYYKTRGERAAKRSQYMPMSAAMLRRVAKHFHAKKVVFLDITMRDAMAHHLHARNAYKNSIMPFGLQQLFSPSTPSPALRA